MASLLDSVSRTALPVAYMFSSTFGQQYGGKIVFYPGAAWMGGVFPGLGSCTTSNADCTMAAGYPADVGSSGPSVTGAIGGGLWFVSSHSKNLKLAASAVVWLDTNLASQKLSPGYPAYGPDDAPWVADSGRVRAPTPLRSPVSRHSLRRSARRRTRSGPAGRRCRTPMTRSGPRTSCRRSRAAEHRRPDSVSSPATRRTWRVQTVTKSIHR